MFLEGGNLITINFLAFTLPWFFPSQFIWLQAYLCLVYHAGNSTEKRSYVFEDLSSFSIAVTAQVPIETESKSESVKYKWTGLSRHCYVLLDL